MTLSMFVKGKIDYGHVQIWLWVCLSKEKFFRYIEIMFVKGKIDFRHI
jgi:hypothetical protein